MRSNRFLLAILLAALGLLGACGGDDGPDLATSSAADDETSDGETADDESSDDETTVDEGEPITVDRDALTDSSWVLRFGGGPEGEVPIVDGWPVTLTFRDDGTLGGTAACNGYGGSYAITTVDGGSQLTIDDLGSTDMGCEPEVAASEAAFLAALLDVDGINLSGEADGRELALSGMSTELIFASTTAAPVDELLGQLWLLEALVADEETTGIEGEPATLLIEADGGFTGSTGCRELVGRYLISGNEVLFNEMAAEGDCPTSLSEQDGFVINVLGDGFVPTIEGDILTLTSVGNEQLQYRAVTEDEAAAETGTAVASDGESLDGIEWTFAGGDSPDGPIADPRTVDPTAAITLTFTAEGYEGIVICNAYGGEAEIESLWNFTLGVPQAEEQGCGDGLDEIATAYLDALPQMTEGGIEGDGERLVINGNEIELLFERTG